MFVEAVKTFCHVQFLACILTPNPDVQVVQRGAKLYDSVNYQRFLQNPVQPLGYLIPSEYREVQRIIVCARKYAQLLAVLGGGHSLGKFGYGSNEHWVLSVQNLNSISVDKVKSIARVGSGVKTDSLRHQLWNSGHYGLPYGSCTSVGVSGYTLGGGMGRSSRKHGLMSDRALEMDIVLANGTLVTANDNQHADLFWALRGAGIAGFGVVVGFTFSLFQIDHENYQIVQPLTIEEFQSVFSSWQKWAVSDPDPAYGSFLCFDSNGNTSFLEFTITDRNPEKRLQLLEKIRKEFPIIGHASVTTKNYKDMFYPWEEPPSYQKFKSLMVSKELNATGLKNFERAFQESLPRVTLVFEADGGNINKRKRNATAYVHRDNAYRLFLIVSNKNFRATIEAYKALDILYDSIFFASNGEAYQNCADEDLISWTCQFYGTNFDRLVKIKRMYDPKNFFQHPNTIPIQ